MRRVLLRFVGMLAISVGILAGTAAGAAADAPVDGNISPVVVPLAQTATFGQTVCSVLGPANQENNVVLTVQGHTGHIV